MTAKGLLDLAQKALDEDKIDEANSLISKAEAQAKIESATPPATDPPAAGDKPKTLTPPAAKAGATRIPFPVGDDKGGDDKGLDLEAREWAAKQLYVKKYGAPEPAFDRIAHELYAEAGGYYLLAALKQRDFNRYLRSGQGDPRLIKAVVLTPTQIAEAVLEGVSVMEIKATLVEAQDTLGGYLVPEDFQQNEIISRLPGLTVVRPLATVRQTVRDVYSVAKRTGGTGRYIGNVRVFAVDESPATTGANTNPTFGKVSIPIHTLMADVAISKSVLEDTAVDLSMEVGEEFAIARAIFEDQQFLTGNGVGVPRGILLDGTTGGPMSSDIATVNSGGATSIAPDAVKFIPYNLDGQYRQAGAVWAMSKGTVRVTKALKSGDGNYLWSDRQNQLLAGTQPLLEGYPVKESEALASPITGSGTIYTAGTYPAIFGDFKGYRVVDRIGMSITRYEDYTTARNDLVAFIMRWRGGGDVTNPERFVVMKISA